MEMVGYRDRDLKPGNLSFREEADRSDERDEARTARR